MAYVEGGPTVTITTMANGEPASGAGQAEMAIQTHVQRFTAPQGGRRLDLVPTAASILSQPTQAEGVQVPVMPNGTQS